MKLYESQNNSLVEVFFERKTQLISISRVDMTVAFYVDKRKKNLIFF